MSSYNILGEQGTESHYFQIYSGNVRVDLDTPQVTETDTAYTVYIPGFTFTRKSARPNQVRIMLTPSWTTTVGDWIIKTNAGTSVHKDLSTKNWSWTVNKQSWNSQELSRTFTIQIYYYNTDGTSILNDGSNTKTWQMHVDHKTHYSLTIDGTAATKVYGEDYALGYPPARSNTENSWNYSYYPNKPGENQELPTVGSAKITTSYTFKGWLSSAGGLSNDGLSYTGNAPSTITSDWTSSRSPLYIMHPSGVIFNPTKTGFIYKGLSTSPTATLPDDVSANGGWYLPYRELYGVWNHELVLRNPFNPTILFKEDHVSKTCSWGVARPTYYQLPEDINLPTGLYLQDTTNFNSARFILEENAPSVDFMVPWEPLESTIHYIANGGEGEMESTVYTPLNGGTTTRACEYTPADPAQKFLEWNTKSNGSGTSYKPGDDIRLDEKDVYLYAQWNYHKMYVSIPDSWEGKKVYIDVSVDDKEDN